MPGVPPQQFSVCLAEKRRDTIEIFQGSCQGIKGPPYGGPFFPCHPPEPFLASLRWSVTERITGSSRKERKNSGKVRIICRILVVVRIICLKWRIAVSQQQCRIKLFQNRKETGCSLELLQKRETKGKKMVK
jgi:hypothetical protein